MNTRRTFLGWLGSVLALPFVPKSAKAESSPIGTLSAWIMKRPESPEKPCGVFIVENGNVVDEIMLDGCDARETEIAANVAASCFRMAHRHYTGKFVVGPQNPLPVRPRYTEQPTYRVRVENADFGKSGGADQADAC